MENGAIGYRYSSNEADFMLGHVERIRKNLERRTAEKKMYINSLALRARRGEKIGRDAVRKARKELEDVTFIYFILCGDGEAIKIGRADDVKARLSQLQVGSHKELKVIASFAATEDVETFLHWTLKPYHIRGEWFRCSNEVLQAAEAALDGGLDLVLTVVEQIVRKRVDLQSSSLHY